MKSRSDLSPAPRFYVSSGKRLAVSIGPSSRMLGSLALVFSVVFGSLNAPQVRAESQLADTASLSLARIAAGIAADAGRLEAMGPEMPAVAKSAELSAISQRVAEHLRLDLGTPAASATLRETAATLSTLAVDLRSTSGRPADELLVGIGLTEEERAALRSVSSSAQDVPLDDPTIVGTNVTPTLLNFEAVGLLLFRSDSGDSTSNHCTGTLVGPTLVLTAAHCVCFDPVLGTSQKRSASDCTSSLRGMEPKHWTVYFPHGGKFQVSAIQIDPNYNFAAVSGARRADLALMTLASGPRSVRPIPVRALPEQAFSGRIVGFGFFGEETETMVAAADGVENPASIGIDARAGLRATGLNTFQRDKDKGAADDLVQHSLIAGQSSSVICSGDSGGPLIDTATGAVVGVASGVTLGCDVGAKGRHVRIDQSPLFQNISMGNTSMVPFNELDRLDRADLTILPTIDREIALDTSYATIRIAANAMQKRDGTGALLIKATFDRAPLTSDPLCDLAGSYAKFCTLTPPVGAQKLFVHLADSKCIGLQNCKQTAQLLVTGEH